MIKINDKNNKYILVLGCGGTGSWLIQMLSKLDFNITPCICDGDIVEQKNCLRQNFNSNDINMNKAEVLAKKNNFDYIDSYIENENDLIDIIKQNENVTPIIIGCLDNNATRKIVHNVFLNETFKDFIWLDAGNRERNGQVYVAIKEDGNTVCSSPLDIDFNLNVFEEDERKPSDISCAEQSQSSPQNVSANITSATILFDLINIILNNGVILGNKYSFDTKTMIVKPSTVKPKQELIITEELYIPEGLF